MTSPDVLRIACDDCVMRATAACDDCLVTFVCEPRAAASERAVVLDLEEHRAIRRLQDAGLLPVSRHRARTG